MPRDLFEKPETEEDKAEKVQVKLMFDAFHVAMRDNVRGFMRHQFMKMAEDERRRTGG